MDQDRIIAVGLLTRRDLNLLGPTFDRAWPVDEAPDFRRLLKAIDEADERLRLDGTKRGGDSKPLDNNFC